MDQCYPKSKKVDAFEKKNPLSLPLISHDNPLPPEFFFRRFSGHSLR